MEHTAYISIGSNMGDKIANCRNGIAGLAQTEGIAVVRLASCYRTAPVDYLEQDWFINTVVKIKTSLPPTQLLRELKAIETNVGRKPSPVRFGPRILDLDIVMYDDDVIEQKNLIVPHPRMHERRFVLQPVCDINPDALHPVLGLKIADLLALLDGNQQPIEEIPCDFSSLSR